MEEKHLLSQLNNLKSIKPDTQWKKESRDVLLSQISAGDCSPELSGQKISISYYFKTFFHQPALVVTMILLIVLGGGVFGIASARNSKPGDSLYIAKIISEKAQLAVAFSEKDKAKLGIEFAGNRAKEIAQVLAEKDNSGKQGKVETLARNFKKEINAAKIRLKNINVIKNNKEENKDIKQAVKKKTPDTEKDTQVFSANFGKKDKGVQVYDPSAGNSNTDTDIATNTGGLSAPASDNSDNIEQALGEAEELFAKKDYGAVSDKLKEVNVIIDESNNEAGEPEDSATTTKKVKVLEIGADAATSTEK